MMIRIKLNGLKSISLPIFAYSKSTTETFCAANLEHVIIGRYISLKVSKQLTVLGHSMLAEIV